MSGGGGGGGSTGARLGVGVYDCESIGVLEARGICIYCEVDAIGKSFH